MDNNFFEVENFDKIKDIENWEELWAELKEYRESLVYHVLEHIAKTQSCLKRADAIKICYEYLSTRFEGDKLEQMKVLFSVFSAETIEYMLAYDILREASSKKVLIPTMKGDRMLEAGKDGFPKLERLRKISEGFKGVETFTMGVRIVLWAVIVILIVLIPFLYGLRLILR